MRLLVVDDEKVVQNSIALIIKKENLKFVEMETASTGKEAIEKTISFHPDVVFMDINMPGLNGIDGQTRETGSHQRQEVGGDHKHEGQEHHPFVLEEVAAHPTDDFDAGALLQLHIGTGADIAHLAPSTLHGRLIQG